MGKFANEWRDTSDPNTVVTLLACNCSALLILEGITISALLWHLTKATICIKAVNKLKSGEDAKLGFGEPKKNCDAYDEEWLESEFVL